jgi:predicted AAA+ superfamily ATPase
MDSKIEYLIGLKNLDMAKIISETKEMDKSYLLLAYKDYLLNTGVESDNIIYIDFNKSENDELRSIDALFQYVSNRQKNNKLYILINEAKYIDNWQKFVNGTRVELECDMTVTVSVKDRLFYEIERCLSARFMEIKLIPEHEKSMWDDID